MMEFPDWPQEHIPEEISVSFHWEGVPSNWPANSQEKQIRNWLEALFNTYGQQPTSSLSYIFCTDSYLHQVNITYLAHDTYTDIITFQEKEGEVGGDIYISLERVQENALSYHASVLEELLRTMAHGILHMVGYKDKKPKEKELMRDLEQQAIRLFHSL